MTRNVTVFVTVLAGTLVATISVNTASADPASKAARQVLSAKVPVGNAVQSVPQVGQLLPDIAVRNADGKEVRLGSLKGHYTVLIFGCVTCDQFMKHLDANEVIAADYAEKGVEFYYVQKGIIHPERRGLLHPYTQKEWLMLIGEAQQEIGSKIPWLCDTDSGDLQRLFVAFPNQENLVGPDGRIIRLRRWSNPTELRKDLEHWVGTVEQPTEAQTILRNGIAWEDTAIRGVIKKLEKPMHLTQVEVVPDISRADAPYYSKLRAEVDRNLLRTGKGKLYLRFELDPLYHVQWHNVSLPLQVTLSSAGEMAVTLANVAGPKVREPADADPREFLIDVDVSKSKVSLEILATFVIVSNRDAMSTEKIRQSYTVNLVEVD